LRHHLWKKRIALDIQETVPGRERLVHSDLVILDPFKVQMNGLKDDESQEDDPPELQTLIENVRSVNADVPLLLVLPTDSYSSSDDNTRGGNTIDYDDHFGRWKPENVVAEFFHGSSLRLRRGKDAIVRKPTWLSANGHSDSEAGFADQIFSLLDNENRFDVKYQVLVPVGAVLGRCGEHIHGMYQAMRDEEDLDRVFSPLLPFLVQEYGLSASLRDLCEIESAELASALRSQVRRDQRQNKDHWSHVDERTINDVLDYFAAKGIRHPSVKKHVTLENWMRKFVDRRAREKYDYADSGSEEVGREMADVTALTQPLSLLFGGSTRYEFSARGSWYKSATERVDDILIVVEFCAQSSIVARQVIKDLAVRYLGKVAGEEAVMVQEVSTDAHIWSNF
jgi:hypothetical protein